MQPESIDWNNYEIPLGPAAAPAAPPAPRAPRSGPVRAEPRAVLRSLGRSFLGLVFVFVAAVVASLVWYLFYERIWGPPPQHDLELLREWMRRRAVSVRVMLLCGGLVGEIVIWSANQVIEPDKALGESDVAVAGLWTFRALRWALLLGLFCLAMMRG